MGILALTHFSVCCCSCREEWRAVDRGLLDSLPSRQWPDWNTQSCNNISVPCAFSIPSHPGMLSLCALKCMLGDWTEVRHLTSPPRRYIWAATFHASSSFDQEEFPIPPASSPPAMLYSFKLYWSLNSLYYDVAMDWAHRPSAQTGSIILSVERDNI